MADFAAAQKRIVARGVARESARTAAEAAQGDGRRARLSALPPRLRPYALPVLGVWDVLASPYGTRPAFRVAQLDAELLDDALLGLLQKQAGQALRLYGAHLPDDHAREIRLVLGLVLWKLGMWDHAQSYGAGLQGLKYVDARPDAHPAAAAAAAAVAGRAATKWQRLLHGLIAVGGRYGWARWEDRLGRAAAGPDRPTVPLRAERLARSATTALSAAHHLAAFAAFVLFLSNGRHRTLTDRLLRLRLVPASNHTRREISFEFLNRQLVWHALTEFLLFALPLVGIARWRRWIARAWKRVKRGTAALARAEADDGGGGGGGGGGGDARPGGELAFLPERTCAICHHDQTPTAGGPGEHGTLAASAGANAGIVGSAQTDITNPYEADPCACIYCFVCLAQRIEAEEGEGFPCLRCGAIVRECRPWNGDVLPLEPRRRRRRRGNTAAAGNPHHARKSVMFDLDEERQQHQQHQHQRQRQRQLEDESKDDAHEQPGMAVEPVSSGESAAWSEVRHEHAHDDESGVDADPADDSSSEPR